MKPVMNLPISRAQAGSGEGVVENVPFSSSLKQFHDWFRRERKDSFHAPVTSQDVARLTNGQEFI
jgi:hypothetical protein